MDVLDLLISDHNRIRGLFKLYGHAAGTGDHARMSYLVSRLSRELEVHTRAEERAFYSPANRLSGKVEADIAEGLEEHHVAEQIMSELTTLEPASEHWVAKVKVLIESVEHHLDEEEADLFPAVRGQTRVEDRRVWGAEYEETQRALGAPTVADKIDLTTKVLRRMASEQEIPGRSKMGHDQLAAAVAPRV